MTIKSSIKLVTPAMAENWLADPRAVNPRGRTNQSRVNSYANQIANNQWQMTGETIGFDTEGVLKDGFHRLMGVVKANKAVKMIVVTGIDPQAAAVMDSGLSRSMADVISADSEVPGYAAQVAATSKMILGWEQDIVHSNSAMTTRISRTDVVTFAREHYAQIIDCIQRGENAKHAIGGSTTSWSSFLYRVSGSEYDQDIVNSFYNGVVSGAGLELGDPRLACRNWFITSKMTRRRNSPGVTKELALQIIVRAWNLYANNDTRQRIMQSQVKGELIPQPITTANYKYPASAVRRVTVAKKNSRKATPVRAKARKTVSTAR